MPQTLPEVLGYDANIEISDVKTNTPFFSEPFPGMLLEDVSV